MIGLFVALAAGLWLRWDALHIGFHGDDYVQMAMLRGKFPAPRSSLDLFRFADGSRDGTKLIDFGYDPWWSEPNLKIAMFRPLSSGLIALDHRLFGPRPVHHHAHSLVWWVLTMLACAAFFSRVLPARVAALALVLFAIEEAHTVPVAWVANRSTLVSIAFGLLGLWIHVQYRQSTRVMPRVAEALVFCLALAGGEYAFSVLAYVLAFEVFASSGPPRERLKALYPAFSAAALCLVARAVFGFGVSGSGAYISPTEAPGEFVRAAIERIPALIGDLVWGIPAAWFVDGLPWAPDFKTGRNWQVFMGWLGLLAVGYAVRFLKKSSAAAPANDSVVWLFAGAILSIVPSASALPEDRTLLAAAVGASAIFAALLVRGYDGLLSAVKTRRVVAELLPVALAAVVLFVHVNQAWARSRDQVSGLAMTVLAQRRWALRAQIPDEGAAERRLIILTGADFTTIANLPFVRLAANHPLPHSYTRLSGALQVHEITRLAPNAIELATLSNELDQTMVGSLYRRQSSAFQNGDAVTLDAMRVEVLATDGPNPWLLRITFKHSLDDPRYLFLNSTPDGIRPFALPAVGEKLRVAAPSRPRL